MSSTVDEVPQKKNSLVIPIHTTEEELKFRAQLYPDVSTIENIRLQCTVCFDDIKLEILRKSKVYPHIYMCVLLCKACYDFYGNGEFSIDEDGLDKYCRWCGQGGKLFICSKCPRAFCKKCVKQNLTRRVLSDIKSDDWQCFFCKPEPLFAHRALCWAVDKHISNKREKVGEKKQKEGLDISFIKLEEMIDNVSLKKKGIESISLEDFYSSCDLAKASSSQFIKEIEKLVKKVKSKKSLKSVHKVKLHKKMADIISEFQTILTKISKKVNNDLTIWESKLQAEGRTEENYNEVITIDETPEEEDIVNCKEKSYEAKNRSNEKNDNNENERTNNLEDLTVVNDDGTKNNEIKKNSVEEPRVSKPLLRIRNIDEVNKVISEDKTGDLFNVENSNEIMSKENVIENSNEIISKENVIENSNEIMSEEQKEKSVDKTDELIDLDIPTKTKDLNNESTDDLTGSLVRSVDNKKHSSLNNEICLRKCNGNKGCNLISDSDIGKETIDQMKNNKYSNTQDKEKTNPKSKGENESKSKNEVIESNDEVKSQKSLSSEFSLSSNDASKNLRKLNGDVNDNDSNTSSTDFDLSDSNDLTKNKKRGSNINKSKTKVPKATKKKKPGAVSDSDEDIRKLLDDKSLNKRKRHTLSDSSSCEFKEKPKKSVKKTKKSKKCTSDELDSSSEKKSDSESSIDISTIVMNFDTMKEEKMDYASISQNLLATKTDSDSDDEMSDDIFSDDSKKVKVKQNKQKLKQDKESGNNSDDEKSLKKDNRRKRDKLLCGKLSDTDSSEEERKWKDRKENAKEKSSKKKVLKGKRKKIFSSNSSSEKESDEINEIDSSKSSLSAQEEEDSAEDQKKKKRKRIQKLSTESDSDTDTKKKCPDSGGKGRKNIRKVLKTESLEKSTLDALKEEQERKKRIAERQKLYNKMMNENVVLPGKALEELVLDFDADAKKELVAVDKDLVKKMKPHQAEGIKFMWNACFESLKLTKATKGSGCILAHCMGLGKSFQVVSLIHTLVMNPEIGVKTVLVLCPLTTVENWAGEFEKWLKDVGSGQDLDIFSIHKASANNRQYMLRDWQKQGGVMVMAYGMFRALANPAKRLRPSVKKAFEETLLDPGPDLIICDEGHVLKNESTALSSVISKVKTLRRIVLTGTPLQNNLVEYHCMVQFVKPNLLGTKKEFKNRFVNPIVNGQFEDSTPHDVKIMKRRAHVLHKLLDGIVQRKDYNVLTPYLPQKYEYVISLVLSDVQCALYQHYLDHLSRGGVVKKAATLFADWQCLSRICTHPRILSMHSEKEQLKRIDDESEGSSGSLKNFIDDGSDTESSTDSESSSSSKSSSSNSRKHVSNRRTRSNPIQEDEKEEEEEVARRVEWWSSLVTPEQMEELSLSPKILMLFTILKKCEEIGDKLLVFSQSLISLDLIEYFLQKIDESSTQEHSPLKEYAASWIKGCDYFRLDGNTASDYRTTFINHFNNEKNTRARLFLISTKAGGLGINLVAANRVIIFDASWNPSHDVQSIFRIYRFGQKKPCYIYRFLAQGTMEEKIYERQVAKLSISCRVVDEQQVDRHFSHSDLTELYTFNPQKVVLKSTPALPKDRLMAELLQMHSEIISTHHQHDSLLENVEDEELNEEERLQAWQDFENEKNAPPPPPAIPTQESLIANIIARMKAQNPSLTDEDLQQKARKVFYDWQKTIAASYTPPAPSFQGGGNFVPNPYHLSGSGYGYAGGSQGPVRARALLFGALQGGYRPAQTYHPPHTSNPIATSSITNIVPNPKAQNRSFYGINQGKVPNRKPPEPEATGSGNNTSDVEIIES